MKKGIIGLAVVLSLSLLPAYSATPLKAGSVCSKQGVTRTYQGKKFTCIKSGQKLVWGKGVVVKKLMPTPAPTTALTLSPTPTSSPTSTPSATLSPTPTPLPTPEFLSVSDSVESCKIVDASNPDVGVYGGGLYGGFNEKAKPIPSSGNVTWYLVPVDFVDLKGETDWRPRVNDQMQLLTEYYEMVSYGKLKIQWKVHDTWITLPGIQKDYTTLRSGDYSETEFFWKNAISSTDPKIDFTGVQVVNFLLPKDQTAFVESNQGFPWTGDINKFNSNEFKLSAFTLLGNYFSYSYRPYWSYWAHEYGHTLGIPHIGSSRSSYSFQQYDLMGDQDARRELTGWSRFAVTKWLHDDWVYCKKKENVNSEIVHLNDLNSNGDGNKIVIIPISSTKTLIAESRRSTKFVGSQRVSGNTTGVFVYIYDSTLGHNQEYLTLIPSLSDSILTVNESVTYQGVTIKVLSVGTQDKILITRQ